MTDLRSILARLGLEKYTDRFIDEGFETWDTILDITESDLDALGVKLGHRRILQREIAQARGVTVDHRASLNSPASSHISPDPRNSVIDEAREEHASGSSNRTKRKYRRHPKADENAPDRPPSAYVIFSNKVREELRPLNLSFTDIAKRVGENWQVLSPEEKEPYEVQASAAKEKYHAEMAAYKMTDSYRGYMQYLAEFKAKNAANADGKRPRLEHEQSTTSSASLGSATEQEVLSNNMDDGHRRLDSGSPAGPHSTTGSLPSPVSSSLRGLLPHGGLGSTLPLASGSPISTSSSSPSHRRDSSLGPLRPPLELYPDRLSVSGGSQHHLPRLLSNETRALSLSSSSTTPIDPRLAHARRSPLGSTDGIPTLMHQASDSSKSSITSNQSSTSTAASSLYAPRALEDDNKPSVVLPPLSTLAHLPNNTSSPADHALRPNVSPHSSFGRSPHASQQASQPPFASISGMEIDSLELPLPHKIFFGQEPEPWPNKGAKLANIFDLQDIPSVGERYPPPSLTLQPSGGSETRGDALEADAAPHQNLPSIRRISPRSDGSDPSSRPNTDPLSVLADAAHADRDFQPSFRKSSSFGLM